MTLPAVIASDLDGTALQPNGRLSLRTRNALEAAIAAGVQVVFVTARPARWIGPDLTVGGGLVLCSNGAVVFDPTTRTIVDSHPLDSTTLTTALDAVRQHIPGVGVACETTEGLFYEPAFAAARADTEPVLPGDIEVATVTPHELAPTVKALVGTTSIPHDELYARVTEAVGQLVQPTFSGIPGMVELGPIDRNKAVALAEWCAQRNVTADQVWAFGDMPNDTEMLRWAGTGFAVANAHPDVITAADATCPANTDEGLAQTIEAMLNAARADSTLRSGPTEERLSRSTG